MRNVRPRVKKIITARTDVRDENDFAAFVFLTSHYFFLPVISASRWLEHISEANDLFFGPIDERLCMISIELTYIFLPNSAFYCQIWKIPDDKIQSKRIHR